MPSENLKGSFLSAAAALKAADAPVLGKIQDSWQQQRELSLMYVRFYGALLVGILLTYQLQKCVFVPSAMAVLSRVLAA